MRLQKYVVKIHQVSELARCESTAGEESLSRRYFSQETVRDFTDFGHLEVEADGPLLLLLFLLLTSVTSVLKITFSLAKTTISATCVSKTLANTTPYCHLSMSARNRPS